MEGLIFTTFILDGKTYAKELTDSIKGVCQKLTSPPKLAVILVGDDPASDIYVTHKERACANVGITSLVYRLPSSSKQEKVQEIISKLNDDKSIDGILLQLPLPNHLSKEKLIASIDPKKDVDGFHPLNLGNLLRRQDGFVPCTPLGCLHLIEKAASYLKGKNAVIIGRSLLVGQPLAILLTQRDFTVTLAHSKTENLMKICQGSDLLISAVGRPFMINGDWIKPGAVVIDVGINRLNDGKVVGDVDFKSCLSKAGAITPVPGGVGPLTIAFLLQNTLKAHQLKTS